MHIMHLIGGWAGCTSAAGKAIVGVTISLLVADLTIAVARRLPLGGGGDPIRVGGLSARGN